MGYAYTALLARPIPIHAEEPDWDMAEVTETCIDDYLRILNLSVTERLGYIRHALFDFDGTISTLRQGWEEAMIPVMLEAICGSHPVTPEIEQEVREYVDRSTGILTIEQMRWLVDAVRRHGLAGEPLTAAQYKQIYLDRLLVTVNRRVERVRRGEISPSDAMILGAGEFLRALRARGVTLYLASGTDHPYVIHEASVLKIDHYFTGGIYGALDATEANNKERIIQRILDEHRLSGQELLVVGDGPVEIREAVARGAIALGMATDEVARRGWNRHKMRRLISAGADMLAPDFSRPELLIDVLFNKRGITPPRIESLREHHGQGGD
ncbi:MAG: HAD family hydrolase [Anaerolineae bacterium]|nr:HAD family hydrolase [Anaerolineae bacterium]